MSQLRIGLPAAGDPLAGERARNGDGAAAAAVPYALPRRLERWALAAVVAIVFASVALLAVAHVDDRYNVNHVAGSWMALADSAASGTLYPPVFEDGYYGGTRYLPVPTAAHAVVAWLTDEVLVSGKLVAYLTALLLFALVFATLRRLGCSRLVSLALIALVLVTPVGLLAATGIRGDAASVVFQLAALAVVARSTSRASLGAAAALSALGVMSKLTGWWAVLAIGLWLLVAGREERRKLPLFAGVFAASLAVLVGLFELLSSGRMSDNVLTAVLGRDEASRNTIAGSVSSISQLVADNLSGVWLLLPFALLAVIAGLVSRRPSLYQLAFLVQLPILVVIFTEVGADYNQLLDLAVLSVLVVGGLWAQAERGDPAVAAVGAVLVLATVVGAAESFRVSMKSDVGAAAKSLVGNDSDRFSTTPLAGLVDRSDTILSEDPTIPLLLDQRPVVLDASMLPLVENRHPEYMTNLRSRVEDERFSKIVLMKPITDVKWYSARKKFGEVVSTAIRENYRLWRRASRGGTTYFVYVPA